jgi:hypothetical protein
MDGAPEAHFDFFGKVGRPAARQHPGQEGQSGIDGQPRRQGPRKRPQQFAEAKREADPAFTEVQATVSLTDLEVVAQQLSTERQDLGGRRRMQTMRSVIDPLASNLEAPGHPPDPFGCLQHHHPVPGSRRIEGRHQPRWARPQHYDVCHEPFILILILILILNLDPTSQRCRCDDL